MASPLSPPPSSSSSSTGSTSSTPSHARDLDPYSRNALRYAISPREYQALQAYLHSRTARGETREKRTPRDAAEGVKRAAKVVLPRGPPDAADYNAAAVRAALRVFVGTWTVLKIWEKVKGRLARGKQSGSTPKVPFYKATNTRLSAALSMILLSHRLLFRFFLRLRSHLLLDNASAFRARNPRLSALLTSSLTPALGASLSGFWLGLYPAEQLRTTIAIYTFTRSLEFLYNLFDNAGALRGRKPWWFGAWLLMPLSCGQLLHAFVFDRDCFPDAYSRLLLRNSEPVYLHARPAGYPAELAWPSTTDVVDALADMARLRWPKFTSPILFPAAKLPASSSGKLALIAPLTAPAHPAITNLSCATLHPGDPSCLRTYITFYLRTFPRIARFFTLIYGGLALLRLRTLRAAPLSSLNALAQSILRLSLFLTAAIGTSWASICFFAANLPKGFLPTQRFFLAGLLGGSWAFIQRNQAGSNGLFLYSARASLTSAWQVAVKRRWVRPLPAGSVWLFVASLALVGGVYELDPRAVSGGVLRKGLSVLRGEGWVDRALVASSSSSASGKDEKPDESANPPLEPAASEPAASNPPKEEELDIETRRRDSEAAGLDPLSEVGREVEQAGREPGNNAS